MITSDDDTEVQRQPSIQYSSEQSSNAPTLIMSPSAEDTEVQSPMQPPEEGGQSIASRTRYQLARQRTTTMILIYFTPNFHHRNKTHKHRLCTPTQAILSRHLNSQMTITWLVYKTDLTTFTPLLGKSHKGWFIYEWDIGWGSWVRVFWHWRRATIIILN